MNFGHFFLRTGTQSSEQGQQLGDIELGENISREAAEQTQSVPDLKTQAEEARNQYRDSLRRRFGGGLVQHIMNVVEDCEDER